jgi:hypothetical protein
MKPDLQALINKAKDSLGAAKNLVRDGYFDFAASRAYYAMFYVPLRQPEREAVRLPGPGHKKLVIDVSCG